MKPRLTPDEHIELGRTLARINAELSHRFVQVANAYPLAGREGVAARKLESALKALSEARSALDDALAREHPEAFHQSVYYPGSEDRESVSQD